MSSIVQRGSVLLANILLVGSIIVFALGFFPHKAFLPGLATWPAEIGNSHPAPPFDKLIFMVVDALRSDFVYGNASNFAFTQSLIRSGAALPFTGHASPPTITMPRVKAITTGSVPSFVDLVLNFAESDTTSTLATQDSWLAQIRAQNRGLLVMYGDDTWLRLFPNFFGRADGTTSFFVSDFTEVDNNVTRHIPDELARQDWSAMTMHFLGLDHIGHKTGPRGPNMPGKQTEMDGIVHDIYTAMEERDHLQSCLLVLLGDHGMNEGGNHGASSPGEVSTALTFISPKFKSSSSKLSSPLHDATDFKYYKVVQQSDIVPTLAALLGFPIPRNNLGIIIPGLLDLWSNAEEKYSLLYENAKQISAIAQATFPSAFDIDFTEADCKITWDNDADILGCLWHKIERYHRDDLHKTAPAEAIEVVQQFLLKAQSTLSGTASDYNVRKLHIGIALGGLASMISVYALSSTLECSRISGTALILLAILYSITMFASSYVEEEQDFWYWTLGAWLSVLFCRGSRYKLSGRISNTTVIALVYLLSGIVRRWRQTGQKYAGAPDIVSELITPNPGFLWAIILATYAAFTRSLSQKAGSWTASKQMAILPVLVSISAFVFKVAFTAADAPELLEDVGIIRPLVTFASKYPLPNLARVVFLGITHLTGSALFYETPWKNADALRHFIDTFHDIVSLFLITQSRTTNIPLFLIFYLQLRLLQRGRPLTSTEVTVTSLLFQFSSFFAFGGTNAISSIDLSNAYNGVSGYNVVAVGLLTFVSNWVGPIWWSIASYRLMSTQTKRFHISKSNHSFVQLTLFMSVSTLAVMVACTMLREHLFIWTVFSPKYLYTMAWVFGQHLFINGLCSVFFGSKITIIES